MAWRFPEGPFDVVLIGTDYINCRVVSLDGDHLTVERDFFLPLGRVMRVQTQLALEDIKSIHEHAVKPLDDALSELRGVRHGLG
mgnify:FL=1